MNIIPMRFDHIDQAAEMFARGYREQRQAVPTLPERFETADAAAEQLESLLRHSNALAAVEQGVLIGYLGWWQVGGFRNTPRKAAHVPEWAHAAAPTRKQEIYRALYSASAAHWCDAGCATHAITLLAGDAEAITAWFWNGFGLAVVDAIRSSAAAVAAMPPGYTLRKATSADAPVLAQLEQEHMRHYAEPPTLMIPAAPEDAAGYAAFLRSPSCFAYLAFSGIEPAGYLRFEACSEGASIVVRAEDVIANTGAFVRAEHRGHGLASALLENSLANLASAGYQRCSVDFESFNPTAAAFWTKTFQTVCYSLIREPEAYISRS